MAERPSNTSREDTVALPRTPKGPAQGGTSSEANGNGKVLPPMPAGEPAGATPPAAPAARPARAAQPRTTRTPAKKAPAKAPAKKAPAARSAAAATPPPTAETRRPTKAAPARPAAAAAPAPAPAQPSPATQATPAARTETARPVAAPAPVVPPAEAPAAKQAAPVRDKVAKAPKPTREEKRAAAVAAAPKPGRRARLRLTRIDPWSMMKTSFLLSIALGIVIVVSVLMVWTVLGAADVWNSINQTVQDVVGGQEASNFDIEDYLGTRRVVGFTMIVAAVDVVLVTAICTLGAFLYNMSASLLGGIEVTLAEDN